ncbi:MAG: glycoside hydrolase family 3 C-terminal domain-containing protein [Bacilli bacterium]|nr:glycoside hydrolase family 3 C-terminal domain-containing protein [Bacilli bacterium]
MKYKDIIKEMTLEQKASLMTGKNFWETRNIDEEGIPSIFLSDGPHGLRKQAGSADQLGLNASIPATCFPTSASMANSWNVELGEELGKRLGQEAVSQDVSVILGPGTNMKRNPLCGRNFEYFSEDPILAGRMTASYIRGIQSNGIASCVKHFACNNQEERRIVNDSIVDERTLREIYLTAFEIAVKEGKAKALMSSYNLVNGVYANENIHLLKEILRDEWGFKGVVITDWGGDNDRVEGIKAGNELEMPGCKDTSKDIVKAVKEGRLKEKDLDVCVDRLLNLVFSTAPDKKSTTEIYDYFDDHNFAAKCAEESTVLLKNKDSILPLASNKKVAVIGSFATMPRYQGAGSSIVNSIKVDTHLEELKKSDLDVIGYAPGFKRYGQKSNRLIKKAKKLASQAEVTLLYLGLDEVTEAEGLDRPNMKLPDNQIELLKELSKVNENIIVILSCGSVVNLDWERYTKGIVHAYLAGEAGAKAVTRIIEGKVNPSGKLAETYPLKYEDVASSDNFPSHKKTVEYREGPYIGYRYFQKAGVKVRYPFGFGLSYTSFAYSNLKVDDKKVSFTITNTGDYDGKETAELYISKKDSNIIRPVRELKGFAKVFVKKGEKVNVAIKFDDYSFRYFDTKLNKWCTESGEYAIEIGKSCDDIVLSKTIVKEGITPSTNDAKLLPNYYNGKVRNVSDKEFSQLLGREIPNSELKFIKKNRIMVDYNTTVDELKYAKGWVGRLVSNAINFAIKFLKFFGKRSSANTLQMGMLHQPIRGISRMSDGMICWGSLEGLMMMFNGHFHKGLHKFFKERRIDIRETKLLKKARKEQ